VYILYQKLPVVNSNFENHPEKSRKCAAATVPARVILLYHIQGRKESIGRELIVFIKKKRNTY